MLRDPLKKVAPKSSARECGGPTSALLEDNFILLEDSFFAGRYFFAGRILLTY
jgi:hypothetical protein